MVALMYDFTNESFENYTLTGIYYDFIGMNYWQDSFGFPVIMGAWAAYFIGLILAILCDIRPQYRLRHKLLRDFGNIDRYGLRPKVQEDLKDEEGLH